MLAKIKLVIAGIIKHTWVPLLNGRFATHQG